MGTTFSAITAWKPAAATVCSTVGQAFKKNFGLDHPRGISPAIQREDEERRGLLIQDLALFRLNHR
jgi:hypothetical protein